MPRENFGNYKESTRRVYDKFASQYEKGSRDYLDDYLLGDANNFILNLKGNRILDLGSGPGRDSEYFLSAGLRPICIDISPEMVNLCKKKGLSAVVCDVENLPYKNETFHGVWAHTSLLHVPKNLFPSVLNKISQILKSEGLFYIGMKEGNFEGFKDSKRIPGERRFYSLYLDKELRKLLNKNFEILSNSVISLEDKYLNYLCKKKN